MDSEFLAVWLVAPICIAYDSYDQMYDLLACLRFVVQCTFCSKWCLGDLSSPPGPARPAPAGPTELAQLGNCNDG